VSKALALLTLPDDLKEQVDEGSIQASAAYEVARIKDESAQREVVRRIVAEKLTRDESVTAARAAAVSVAPEPTKGRGATKGSPKRRQVATVFRAAGARVSFEFTRKSVREEDVLAALEAIAEQVRTNIAARDANAA
jgi:hypothetical protein